MRFVATALLQQLRGMPDRLKGAESTATAIERRSSQRIRACSLIYVELDDGNGGIVTWISESGLALRAPGLLKGREKGDELGKMQIQLPEFWGAIEATGRIAWRSESGRGAGVKFVDLGEEARDRIERWIAAQTCKNLEQKQPELPKMQLPTARAPEQPGSRFAADVQSSSVGAEEEAQAGHFPGAAAEEEGLSSPLIESDTFVDASKAVASALSLPERRSHSRRPILLFTYAMVGDCNGGLVFNLGEGGLALTAAAALGDSPFAQLRVRFPDSQDWIETKGRLAWISDSGKEAGIEFVGLAEDVRARIRQWVSLGEPAGDSQREESEVQKKHDQPLELPSSAKPEGPVFEISESAASEVGATAPVAWRSALFQSAMKGSFARAAVRRPVAEIKPPKPARPPKHAVAPQGWGGRKVLVAAALVLLGLGWIFRQRNQLKKASGMVAQNVPKAAIVGETKEKTPVGIRESTAESRTVQTLDVAPQAKTMESGAGNLETARDPGVKQAVQNQTAVILTHRPAVNSTLGATDQQERKTAPPRQLRPEPRRGLAPARIRRRENSLAEDKPRESKQLQVLPTPNKELHAAPPSFTAAPIQPEAASTFGKDAPTQPEVPLARTPVVTVSFDPYPSIRMPEKENSKKSRQGKSLQMGHLVLRVDPVYPEEAKQQGVEGVIKLRVVFSREGAVQSLTSLSGPALLGQAAMTAVRQWRYSPTILGGQAMETEEDVTVWFRLLSNPKTR